MKTMPFSARFIFRHFETCTATALKLEPNRSRAWLVAGDCYHRAFATTGRREHLDKAIAGFIKVGKAKGVIE